MDLETLTRHLFSLGYFALEWEAAKRSSRGTGNATSEHFPGAGNGGGTPLAKRVAEAMRAGVAKALLTRIGRSV